MELVKYALKFRVSFYVLALLMMLGGVGAIVVMPKDVLPTVDIPVVVVVWTYTGLDTTDMAQRITTYSEFSLSNNVNSIKRMESTTLQGVAIEKVYFDQSVSIDLAITQVVSAMNSIRAVMPPGIQPPIVMRFSASSVPVVQLALSSEKQSEAQLYDYAQYRIRQTLTQVPGSALPSPYSGAPRQVMVDLDLNALAGYGLTPMDLKITPLFDQLVFVSGAIDNVIREALIASALTGGMILMFLGLWRSTIVVPVSIPLSILCSLIAMTALGETINIMTLGGLALAVGILVDEATVAIENTYRMMEQGRPFLESVV